jgi:tagatose-1,6-bisphosphate aldolase
LENLSLGKLRGLTEIADPSGFFTICAMDHRESMRSMLQEKDPDVVSYEEMVEHKMELCRTLSPHVSAVLLDPNFGAAQAIAGGALSGNRGLLVSIEATGYRGNTWARPRRRCWFIFAPT